VSDATGKASAVITAGYERAQEFLASIGFTGMDVTDITIRREQDAGRRKQFTVSITAAEAIRRPG
jgi:N-acetylglutamate synthase-like GNAT family acetyltransferase